MIYFVNNTKSPYLNLALEEVLTTDETINDEILLLWQNSSSVIIGKNQNTIEEINNEFVKQYSINVVRRLSGGGAVYHDFGNLNFTFIFNKNDNNVRNYQLFTQPIINVLQKLGVKAEFSGKNDILVDGKKISGNAQYVYKNRVMHHGTILFDADLEMLPKVLNPDLLKLKSKGIKSAKASVTNVAPFLTPKISIEKFKELIIEELAAGNNLEIREIDSNTLAKAQALVVQKYNTWEWNYGISPDFNLEIKKRFENKGSISSKIKVKRGIITSVKIFGDFLGTLGTENLENALINQKYKSKVIKEIVSNFDIENIFGVNFTVEEIVSGIIK